MNAQNKSKEGLINELEELQQAYNALKTSAEEDIIRQKQTIIALQASEEHFQLLFNNAPIGYQSLDIEGNFIEVNQQWLSTLGYEREEVIGKWFGDFLTPVFKDGFRKRFPIFKERGKIHSEFEMIHKNGSVLFIAFDGRIGYDFKGDFKQTHCILQDLTNSKHTEKDLIKSREMLKSIEQAAKIGGWEFDVETMTQSWTEETFHILEIDTSHGAPDVPEGIGFIAPEYQPMALLGIQRAIEFGEPYNQEWEVITAKGNKRWINAIATPYQENGKTKYVSGSFQDVTKRKQAEIALVRSEENLFTTLHSIGDGVISTDKNGRIIQMNPVAETLCGWKLTDALRKPLSEVFTIINAETRQVVADPVAKVLEKGEIVGLANHTILVSKNGAEYQIADSAAPIKNKAGELTGVVLVFSDITESYIAQKHIKESEERYGSLLGNLEAGIVVHASDTSIVMNNHRACELLGLTDAQMRGKAAIEPAWKFIYEDNTPLKLDEYPVNKVVSARKPIKNQILGICQPDENETVWVTVNGFPMQNNSGEITEIVISFIDITERKQMEAALRKSENRVRAKLDAILLPEGNLDTLVLEDILDVPAVRGIMENIFNLTGIAVALGDLNGKAIVACGWQDVCTQFHRSHPAACKNCTESDTYLASLIEPGTFNLYKCKNNLWDMAAPIHVDGRHVGSLFVGQFFLDEEVYDLATFKAQAKLYGFNESEYLLALERVPRVSRGTINALSGFYTRFSNMISNLSYSSIQFARMLKERDLATESLRKNEAIQRKMVSNIGDVIVIIDKNWINQYKSPNIEMLFGWKPEDLVGENTLDIVHPEDLQSARKFLDEIAMKPGASRTTDIRYKRKDGKYVWIEITVANFLSDPDINGLLGNYHDITDRKLTEEKLRKSEEQNKAIVLSTPDHIIMQNKDLKYSLVVNPQMGLTEQDMLGKTDYDFLTKEDADNLTLAKNRVIETGEPLHFDTSLISATGKEEFFDGTYIPTFDAHAEVNGLIGYFRNVTERKQSELLLQEKTEEIEAQNEEYQQLNEELNQTNKELAAANELVEKSEIQARDILQTAMDGFWLVDNEGRFINVNQVACKMLGYSREEMLTMTISDVDSEETAEQTQKHLQKIIETGEDRFETKHRCKDGTIIDIEISVKLQHSQNLIVVFVNNITERKIAEEKLKALEQQSRAWLENSPACTKIVDLDFNLQFMSSAGIKGLKIDDITPYYGKPYPFRFYPESFKTKMSGNMKMAIETGKVITQEAPVVDISGNEAWFHSTIVPVKDDNGRIEYLIIVSLDTTERKQVEEAKLKLEEEQRFSIYGLNTAQTLARMGSWKWDIKNNKISWSDEMYHIFGIDKSSYKGRLEDAIINVIHPEDLHIVQPENASEFAKNEINEYRIILPDSSIRYIQAKAGQTDFDTDGNPIFFSGIAQDITDRRQLEAVHTFLSTSGYPGSNENFFESLAKYLAEILNSEYVCIDKLEGDGLTAQTVAIYNEGKFDPNVSYTLKQTPCGDVVGKTICCFPENVCQLFPQDEALQDLKAHSYIGTTLWSYDAKPIGLIAIIGQKPLKNVVFAQNVLKLVAIRAAGELELMQANEKLRSAKEKAEESEEKFKAYTQSSPIAIYTTDEKGDCIYANSEWLEIAGLTLEESLGKGWVKALHPDDKDLVFENWYKSIRTNGNWGFEYRFMTPQGKITHVEGSAKPLYNKANKLIGYLGSNVDITKRKQAELEIIAAKEKAEENEAYLRSVLQSNNDVIVSRDLNNNVVFFNKAFDDITMELFNQHAFTGMNTLNLLPVEGRIFWKNILEKVKNGEPHEEEFSYKTLVKTANYRTSHVPVLHGSKVVGTLEVTKDITAFKNREEELKKAKEKAEESEEKFKLIFDKSLVAILIANDNGDYLSANNAAADLLGFSIEELLKMNVGDLKTTVKPDAYNRYLKYLEIGEEKGEFDFFTKSEEQKIAYYHAVRIKSDFNLSMMINITNQKKTEQDLLIAKLHAEESDRLKSAFLANMSHEIRTPMNGILGFSELLKTPGLTGVQQQEYIAIIEKSGKRMLNIINDIVDISKIEAGLMKTDIKETNINEQIEYVYTFFRPEVESKGIELAFRNALPAKEAILKTDREKVYSILMNLVKNAIKYTPGGSIEFGYDVESGSDNARFVSTYKTIKFYVKDTGIGIPQDRQDAIFERFIQADIADKMARQGAGLGLSISKAYVEMLGGKIWVESQEGIGSIFYFTLPYNAEPVIETINQRLVPSGKTDNVRKLKILIAEDDEVSEMLISINVAEFSNEIINARSGIDAVEIFRLNPDIDLVLMDIQMPGIDGFEATKQIREISKEVIIIAQTAYGLSGDREKSIEAGCNNYIAKPINKQELLLLMQKYFKK